MRSIIISFFTGIALTFTAVYFFHKNTHALILPPDAVLPDSGVYHGDIVNGLFHGHGELRWDDLGEYVGMFEHGLFHGQGRLVMVDGTIYEGEFSNGLMSGYGTLTYTDDAHTTYTGQIDKGLPHGKGELKNDNETYTGEFVKNTYQGQGKQVFSNGSVYTGEFAHNQFNGHGRFEMTDGQIYEGEFVDGAFTGKGEYHDANGSHYTGEFQDWLYHGQGKLVNAKGDTYSGHFKHGYLDGDGEFLGADGSHYQGEFNFGKYDGKGTLTYAQPIDGVSKITGKFKYGRIIESEDLMLNSPEVNNEQVLYNQQALLQDLWSTIEDNNQDSIDLYFLGIAGDGKQAVFRREVNYVSELFKSRFDTTGKSVRLINDSRTIKEVPLATRTSIEGSLNAIAQHMDPEQDILFVYLTSHGSSDFEFSLRQSNFSLPNLSATELASMLDALPIKWKVVVISSCYSGGFIPLLQNDNTLIMTAADKDRTSFGCADKNDFTYFGEAYFSEALSQTEDFINAFDIAKDIISHREKSDDIKQSNPQRYIGKAIKAQLQKWQAQRNHSDQSSSEKRLSHNMN